MADMVIEMTLALNGKNSMDLLAELFDIPSESLYAITVNAHDGGPCIVTAHYHVEFTNEVLTLVREIRSFDNGVKNGQNTEGTG